MGAALMLSACGTTPTSETTTIPEDSEAAPAVPQEQYHSSSVQAVDQLLNEALLREREGDLEGAINQAERALRIEPRNPRVYLVLGQLHLVNGQPHSALQMARKARSLDRDQRYYDAINTLEQDCIALL